MKQRLTPELLVLTVLSALSHFWRLFTPNAVVFDEVHFKHFAGHYFDHTFYFDVHPPLANLLFAAVARLVGVSSATLLGDAPVPVLRVLPALCGTLIVPAGYLILRQLGASRRVSMLGGLALLLDNALLVDTRFAFVEPLIIAAGLGAVSAGLAARTASGWKHWLFVVLSALLAGSALSFKWTGASALGMLGALWLSDVWRERKISTRAIAQAAALVVIPAAVYIATFAVHFALLTRVGPGQAYMPGRFHRTLIGAPQYDPTFHISLFRNMADVHDAMRRGNRGLEYATHPAASKWYTWPIMKHPIAVWEDTQVGPGSKQMIVLLGNPVVWWGVLIGVLAAAVMLVRRRDLTPEHRFALSVLGGGFAINFVPFIFITRLMYLYHYLFALVFGVLVATYVAGLAAGWLGDDGLFHFRSRASAAMYWGLALAIVVGFVFFSPLSFGLIESQRSFDARFWVLHPFG
jgi:dolichyl-phosphate-mannose-protein mannosyltransferase